jgi:hypothetical protein
MDPKEIGVNTRKWIDSAQIEIIGLFLLTVNNHKGIYKFYNLSLPFGV